LSRVGGLSFGRNLGEVDRFGPDNSTGFDAKAAV